MTLEVGDKFETRHNLSTKPDFVPERQIWRVTKVIAIKVDRKGGITPLEPVDGTVHIRNGQLLKARKLWAEPLSRTYARELKR